MIILIIPSATTPSFLNDLHWVSINNIKNYSLIITPWTMMSESETFSGLVGWVGLFSSDSELGDRVKYCDFLNALTG